MAVMQDVVKNIPTLGEDSQLLWCLASCHSLTTIKGEVTGDPLDMKMFSSTLWQLEEEGGDNQKFDKMVSSIVKAPNKVDKLGMELLFVSTPRLCCCRRWIISKLHPLRWTVATRCLQSWA